MVERSIQFAACIALAMPSVVHAQEIIGPNSQTDLGASAPIEEAAVGPDRPLVQVGFHTIAGEARYAVRDEDDSGLTTVRFSSVRPRAGTSGRGIPTSLPVSGRRVSSRFGNRVHPVRGTWSRHSGVDIAVPTGTAVRATSAGRVRSAGWAGAYGLLVIIDHGDGIQTRYAHLSSLNVRAGEAIAEGAAVGRSGSTGRSTGPHVHYEVRVDGRAIDPLR